MKYIKQISLIAAGLALPFSLFGHCGACGAGDAEHEHESDSKEKQDIVATAVAAGDFSTLAAALEAAGLIETLQGEGPFTVFAPTDEAFANLPEGTVESLLKPENKDQLTSILTYHVVPGKVTASDVVELSSAETVQGGKIDIKKKYGSVYVNDAKVVKTDIMSSNGVIHVIDAVILP